MFVLNFLDQPLDQFCGNHGALKSLQIYVEISYEISYKVSNEISYKISNEKCTVGDFIC